ncbi:hypothetical protein [Sorangium sp. So ce590]|uniref:hypothetical protein n=1 Tax=unclassified Sorangium TaxID=2621164 RepID=UPI003F62FE3F
MAPVYPTAPATPGGNRAGRLLPGGLREPPAGREVAPCATSALPGRTQDPRASSC